MGVFHPNADEMHGFTVVITTSDGGAYIGRWMEQEGGRVRIVDACHCSGEAEGARDAFIKKAATWGVEAQAPQLFVQSDLIESVRKLGDVATELRGW